MWDKKTLDKTLRMSTRDEIFFTHISLLDIIYKTMHDMQ